MDGTVLMDFFRGVANDIILISGIMAAFAFIGNSTSKLAKKLRKAFVSEVAEDVRELRVELSEISMIQLKYIICDPHVPIDERLAHGEEYLKRGGNGAIKARVENLRELYIQELAGETVNYGRRFGDALPERRRKER
jgi:hypothetical protein